MTHRRARQRRPGALGPENELPLICRTATRRLPHCRGCGKAVFYQRIACPACDGQAFDGARRPAWASVYATTVMRRPAQAGGDRNLCLVDLDEGVRMMSRIDDADPAAPRIGGRVRAYVRREGEQKSWWYSRWWSSHDERELMVRGATAVVGVGQAGMGSAAGYTRNGDPGPGYRPRGRGCRAAHVRQHRRPVHLQRVGHDVGHAGGRIPGSIRPAFIDSTYAGRIQFRRPPAARHPGADGRRVQRRAGLLRQHAAHGYGQPRRRRQDAAGTGPAALRNALRTDAADQRLRAGGGAHMAPLRHHARAAGRSGGGRARLGPAQSRGATRAIRCRSATCWTPAWCATRSPCATAAC